MKAETIKREIQPMAFYLDALPGMKPPRRFGWTDGGCCPFHDDTKPGSFRVNTESGGFVCYACGARGGDILAFVMARDGVSLPEAVHTLASDWGVSR